MSVFFKKISILKQAIAHESGLLRLLSKTFKVFLAEGPAGIALRIRHLYIVSLAPKSKEEMSYQEWLELVPDLSKRDIESILTGLYFKPKFSIVCPVYEPDPAHLIEAIQSVKQQSYAHWQLIICNDASPSIDVHQIVVDTKDTRITYLEREENGNISAATNTAIARADGEYIAFLDQDDKLAKDSLLWVATYINLNRSARFLYSDEDKLDQFGKRCDPHFKPDWNYQYFLACNYTCHLSVYARDLVETLKGCRLGYEGAQDYDLTLRAIEVLKETEIVHIPRVLYHWRKHADSTSQNALAKPEAIGRGKLAVEDHLKRLRVHAEVHQEGIRYRVKYEIPVPLPPVTILIPTRDQLELLQTCIDSIIRKTTYPNYRIKIIDNGSQQETTLAYLAGLDPELYEVIRDDRPFNYSELMNQHVESTESDLICLLNNDVEVISPDWLSEMVGCIQSSQVAIVGAKLLYEDNTVQHSGVLLGIGGVAGHSHKYLHSDYPGYADRNICIQELSAVTAACMLLKKRFYLEAGGMDASHLSIAFNDVDFCLKVRALSAKIIWTPFAKLYHHESKSRGLEDTVEKVDRFNSEVQIMKTRWGQLLEKDPAYNPNLTLAHENFSLSGTPRLDSVETILSELKKIRH